jgi:hypothetical protein
MFVHVYKIQNGEYPVPESPSKIGFNRVKKPRGGKSKYDLFG